MFPPVPTCCSHLLAAPQARFVSATPIGVLAVGLFFVLGRWVFDLPELVWVGHLILTTSFAIGLRALLKDLQGPPSPPPRRCRHCRAASPLPPRPPPLLSLRTLGCCTTSTYHYHPHLPPLNPLHARTAQAC